MHPNRTHSKEAAPAASAPGEASYDAQFREPSAAMRGKPFWSWNGRLDKEELLRQVDVLEAMGMGGAFMHSRTGLQNEYLGEEWFELIRACADKCADRGLEGWIYDEDRWPSGTAGGQVTQSAEYRMRALVLRIFEAGETIQWPERNDFIEAHVAATSGLTLSSYEPLEYGALSVCPQDKSVLLIEREIHPSNSFYNGGAYLDTLSREATDAFIASTHEKYKAACGDQFGRSIRGIFTDEPHRGFILCDAVQQPGASHSAQSIPYTEGLFEAFESEFGYALKGRLPELFYRFEGERISQLKWHYAELLQRLFLRNWAQPCADWCADNGLELTGHVLHEDSLAAQAIPVGSLLRYYETMSCPGIDVLSNRCESFWVAKQVVSTARQFGKKQVLSELYGATGWDMGFDGHKRIGDWQAFQGINLRCQHLAWYSMAGESKRDYPASIFHQSAWYSEYKYVEDYFARIHWLLSQGEPDCDVLVIHPVESLWAQFHLGWATWLGSQCPDVDALEDQFATLYRWLTDGQVDFDYGDEEQMARLGTVEVIDDEAFYRLGEMSYRTIIVAGMETMRASTLDLLKRFSQAGGSVVFAGALPTHVDALPCDLPQIFAAEIGTAGWNQSSILDAVHRSSEQILSVNKGLGAPGILSHVRRLENGDIVLALVNTLEQPVSRVGLHLEAVGLVERMDCRSGQISPFPIHANGKGLNWFVDFEPLQEHVFRVRVNCLGVDNPPVVTTPDFKNHQLLSGPFAYQLNEPNVLVLDQASFRYGATVSDAPVDILRIDDAVRHIEGWPLRTGTMVQPWCREAEPEVGEALSLEFRFHVEYVPDALSLVLEQPDRWTLELNGSPVPIPIETPWTIDIALREIVLPVDQLQTGENVLRLRTQLRADTDLEAVYLRGHFGVYRSAEGFVIGAMPETLEIGDVVEQGLPFYSGEICYRKVLPMLEAGQPFRCELPAYAGACARVDVGESSQLLAFPPYRMDFRSPVASPELSIRVTLTRQNLFGPFHRVPQAALMTSPDSFRTKGDAYTPGYSFLPAGLLASPEIHY